MKQNDPENLRRPALELLLQLLPNESKAGVWTFGQRVNMLVPHKPVSESWRKEAGKKAQEINSVALFTNIGEALEKAAYDFDKLDPGFRSSLILLTDGVVDISKSPEENAREKTRILTQILPEYIKKGVTIHTVALSHNADKQLMERLAIDTGGIAAVAENADDLMKIFLRAFDDAAPAEQVPLQGNKFLVDSSIEEFTTLVFRKSAGKPTALIGPDGARYDANSRDEDLRWHSAPDYDLITMQRPNEGEWEIKADADPDNRVTIVSNLSLDVTRLPRNVFLGNLPMLNVSLSENGKTIQRKDFLGLLSVNIEVHSPDEQKRWKKSLSQTESVPDNGVYRASLSMLKEPGKYEARVLVDGKTFQRSSKQLLTVREAFELEVEEGDESSERRLISAYARNSRIDMGNTQLLAKIKTPSGKTLIKGMSKSGERSWQLEFSELKHSGEYAVLLEADGQYLNGEKFNLALKPVVFYFDSGEAVPAQNDEVEEQLIAEVASEPEPAAEKESSKEVPLKPEADSGENTELDNKEESSGLENLLLYGGLALGNLLIVVIGFFAYRMLRGSGDSKVLDEDAEESAEIEITDGEAATEAGEDTKSSADAELDPMAEMEQLAGLSGSAEEEAADNLDVSEDIIEIAPDEDDK
jgi:uncharacterized protein (TIGR03503 family)